MPLRLLLIALLALPLVACGLATGSGDSGALLRCPAPQAGGESALLTGHNGAVRAVAWSPDGQILASAGGDGQIRLWSADGAPRAVLAERQFSIHGLSWSPDGQRLVVGTDQGLHFWAVGGTSGDKVPIIPGVMSVAWSPDGRTIAVGLLDGRVKLREADGQLRAHIGGHGGRVESLAWSPAGGGGTILASGATDGSIELWFLGTGRHTTLREHRADVQSLAWRADGAVLASGSYDGTLRLWSADGAALANFTARAGSVDAVAWSADGTLASGSRDRLVRLWDAGGNVVATLTGHSDVVSGAAWSPDGRVLATGSYDCTVRLWRR